MSVEPDQEPSDQYPIQSASFEAYMYGKTFLSILRIITPFVRVSLFEPPYYKTNKVACAPSEDSDKPGHPPRLIRVFAVRFMGTLGPKIFPGGQRRL